jgi:hypothetical protein
MVCAESNFLRKTKICKQLVKAGNFLRDAVRLHTVFNSYLIYFDE